MPFCPNCRDEFEDWVKTCPDCGVSLVNELTPLPKTPFPPPYLKETYDTIIKLKWLPPTLVDAIKTNFDKISKCSWLHHTLVAVLTLIVLVPLLILNPWSTNSEGDSARLNIDIRSGQMAVFTYSEEGIEQRIIDLSWVYPDCQKGKIVDNMHTCEFIIYKGHHYSKGIDPQLVYQERAYMVARHFLYYIHDKGNKELTDLFIEIQKLIDEAVHGVTCQHYTAKIDTDKYIDNLISTTRQELEELESENSDFNDNIHIEELVDYLNSRREENIEVEYWISKSDGILRQIKLDASELIVTGTHLFDVTGYRVEFYNINQPVIINPPENMFGELLPGWQRIDLNINNE
jgi:hypothetical protein